MPAVITHYTFAIQAMLDGEARYREATIVGSQGPDPFFFYGQVPFHKRKNSDAVDSFGRDLHHTEISAPYCRFIEVAAKSPDKDLLFAYIDGLLLHYCLDRNCHPYIFYMTGFTDDKDEKKKYSISHMYFETIIDYILGHENGTFASPEAYLALPKGQCAKISSAWSETNAATLHNEGVDARSFVYALKDYRMALKAAFSKTGKKKALFKKLFGTESHPWAMSYPQSIGEFKSIDFLNLSHKEWLDPVSGLAHKESFLDLTGKARKDYERAHGLLIKAKSGAPIEAELKAFVGGIDHDGVPVGGKKGFQTFVWPRWPL
jgi:hypothetical protein